MDNDLTYISGIDSILLLAVYYLILLCPLHHHPSVVDAALCQVLGLNVPLLPCLPSDWIIMIT